MSELESIGFRAYPRPSSPSFGSSSRARPVTANPTVLAFCGIWRRRVKSSMPCMSGKPTSNSTASSGRASAISSAPVAVWHISTAAPARPSTSASSSALSASSSTTNILMPWSSFMMFPFADRTALPLVAHQGNAS